MLLDAFECGLLENSVRNKKNIEQYKVIKKLLLQTGNHYD